MARRWVTPEPIEPIGYRLSRMTRGYGSWIWDVLLFSPVAGVPHQWHIARKIWRRWYVFHNSLGKVGRLDFSEASRSTAVFLTWVDLDVTMGGKRTPRHAELPAWREGFAKASAPE